MPRSKSGWGAKHTKQAKELAGMWEGNFRQTVKDSLDAMPWELRTAMAATMVGMIGLEHRTTFVSWLRSKVPHPGENA